MNLTTWIDVAIGLTLIYLGVSLFVTIINEFIAQTFNLRGQQLHASLKLLIDDNEIRRALIQSPALESFFKDPPRKGGFYVVINMLKQLVTLLLPTNRLPSYVDPNILGRMLVGSLSSPSKADNAISKISEKIEALPDSSLKTQLQAIARTSGGTVNHFVSEVSDWLDRSLTMMSESYKRNLQIISFGAGLTIAVILNINTITLTQHLYLDKEARDAMTTLAIQINEQTTKQSFEECISSPEKILSDIACAPFKGLVEVIQERNTTLGEMPIGWPEGSLTLFPSSPIDWLGWLLTALAVSLGAPFWFDLLNKIVSIRHGMRKPEATQQPDNKA
jgi:hypothetical protein